MDSKEGVARTVNELSALRGAGGISGQRLDVSPMDSIKPCNPLSEEGLRQWYEENRLAGAAYVRVLTNTLAARYGAWVDSRGQVRALGPFPGDGAL